MAAGSVADSRFPRRRGIREPRYLEPQETAALETYLEPIPDRLGEPGRMATGPSDGEDRRDVWGDGEMKAVHPAPANELGWLDLGTDEVEARRQQRANCPRRALQAGRGHNDDGASPLSADGVRYVPLLELACTMPVKSWYHCATVGSHRLTMCAQHGIFARKVLRESECVGKPKRQRWMAGKGLGHAAREVRRSEVLRCIGE